MKNWVFANNGGEKSGAGLVHRKFLLNPAVLRIWTGLRDRPAVISYRAL